MMLTPGRLTLPQLRQIAREQVALELDPASFAAIDACANAVRDIAAKGEPAYGINTGFGKLSEVRVEPAQVAELQRNLVRSHCCGVGEPLPEPEVRGMLLLRANVLAKGLSGVRTELVELLLAMAVLAVASMTLGLLISALVNSSDKTMPLLVVLVIAGVGLICLAAGATTAGLVVTALALAAAFLNAAFDLCLGCHVYLFIQRNLRVRPSA